MQSQYRLITLAVSLMVSPTRSWMSLALRKMGWAPSCSMPTSKLMRVRVLVFMKIIVTVRPVRNACGARRFCASLSASPRSSSVTISAGLKSWMVRKLRPVRSSSARWRLACSGIDPPSLGRVPVTRRDETRNDDDGRRVSAGRRRVTYYLLRLTPEKAIR